MSDLVNVLSAENPIVVLEYSDLLKDPIEVDLRSNIGAAYGSQYEDALGLLAIRGVPELEVHRANLLDNILAFGQLDHEIQRKYEHAESCYSVGWSHGKESMAKGVPDFSKGSYYFNPIVDRITQDEELIRKWPEFYAPNIWPTEDLPQLEVTAKVLGKLVVCVGQRLARHCDYYVESQLSSYAKGRIHRVLDSSTNCKARLLHYFPPNSEKKNSTWCGWHNDHGSLTGLVPAAYYKDGKEIQVDCAAGLYIRTRTGKTIRAKLPRDCLGFQIGETAQIHSGGVLEATPHYVSAEGLPEGGISRETMAVFLEPQWDEPMELPKERDGNMQLLEEIFQRQSLPQGVPNLLSRWTRGLNFGEFTKKTLAAYYS
jgi:isopenicillin N synthase-like dioxygenase